jgi:hypothetical protein
MSKNLIKNFTLLALLSFGIGALNAQVTVGSNTEPIATLDVVARSSDSKPAGVIAPRMDRKYLNDNEGKYTSALAGTIIYVNSILTGNATNQAVNVTATGYYYFDGTKWIPMRTTTTADNGLTLSGTNVKLGGALNQSTTIDLSSKNLTFSSTTGKVGIGTTAPTTTLHVEGTARITNVPESTNAFDHYLVRDENGNVLCRPTVVSRIGPELALYGKTNWANASYEDILDFYRVDREHELTLPAMPNPDFTGKILHLYIYGGAGIKLIINGVYHNLTYGTFPTGFSYLCTEHNATLTITGENNRFRFIQFICDGFNWYVDNQ